MIVTLIADNYFGYCKKEVKTQISYAANLFGNVEEEHSGGGAGLRQLQPGLRVRCAELSGHTGGRWRTWSRDDPDVDGRSSPRDTRSTAFPGPDLHSRRRPGKRRPTCRCGGTTRAARQSIPLAPGNDLHDALGLQAPAGEAPRGRELAADRDRGGGPFCHKPCTVSGGGKSEISKSLRDYMIYGPIFVADMEKDFDLVQQIFDRDYSDRWKPGRAPDYASARSRPVLSPRRSLGSVIKLLTPSEDYTDEYNEWLASFPNYIFPIVFIIKRFAPPESLGHWREQFGVDIINGFPGHELKAYGRKLVGYISAGRPALTQGWRTFKLRQDFIAADKVQTGDDITASVVVPARHVGRSATLTSGDAAQLQVRGQLRGPAVPAARRRDPPRPGPADRGGPGAARQLPLQLRAADRRAGPRDGGRVTEFEEFTAPMQHLLRDAADAGDGLRRLLRASRGSWTAGRARTRGTCRPGPTCSTRCPRYVAERGMRLSRGDPGRPATRTCPSGPCSSAGATTRPIPRRASAPWPSTARSTTRSCPSCSWISSAR